MLIGYPPRWNSTFQEHIYIVVQLLEALRAQCQSVSHNTHSLAEAAHNISRYFIANNYLRQRKRTKLFWESGDTLYMRRIQSSPFLQASYEVSQTLFAAPNGIYSDQDLRSTFSTAPTWLTTELGGLTEADELAGEAARNAFQDLKHAPNNGPLYTVELSLSFIIVLKGIFILYKNEIFLLSRLSTDDSTSSDEWSSRIYRADALITLLHTLVSSTAMDQCIHHIIVMRHSEQNQHVMAAVDANHLEAASERWKSYWLAQVIPVESVRILMAHFRTKHGGAVSISILYQQHLVPKSDDDHYPHALCPSEPWKKTLADTVDTLADTVDALASTTPNVMERFEQYMDHYWDLRNGKSKWAQSRILKLIEWMRGEPSAFIGNCHCESILCSLMSTEGYDLDVVRDLGIIDIIQFLQVCTVYIFREGLIKSFHSNMMGGRLASIRSRAYIVRCS